MKINKKVVWSIIVVALLVGGYFGLKMAFSKKESVTKMKVRREVIKNTIEISGNISAANEQILQASSDGLVERVFVQEGDFVKKGDPLVWMDSVEEDYSLKLIDYNIEQEKLNGSKRKLELLREERKVKEKKLEDKRLFARFDGVVASLECDPGDFYEAGSTTFGKLINRSYLEAIVEVLEDDVRKLKVGQKVVFDFPALDQKGVVGYVKSFPAVGKITSRGATVVNTNIRIDNPPKNLLPAYSFTGEIMIDEPSEVLTVGMNGIKYEKGQTYAERYIDKNKTELVKVEVLPFSGVLVKVLAGLSEGDEIKAQREISKRSHKRPRR